MLSHAVPTGFVLTLSQHYDTENKFSYDPMKDANLYSEQLQWIFFTVRCLVSSFLLTRFKRPVVSIAWWNRTYARSSKPLLPIRFRENVSR